MPVLVDCIINVCNKPFQTALTLFSLLAHSGRHIDKIYFIEENVGKKGFAPANHDFIRARLADRIEHSLPRHFLGEYSVNQTLLHDPDYRLSVRYQYGWERSDKDFVFITHNDCRYTGDIVGGLLEAIGPNLAAGQIGQCWNCPAQATGYCGPGRYQDYRPTIDELRALYAAHKTPSTRPYHQPRFALEFARQPWPLPECRVNELSCLVNLKKARRVTAPLGSALCFGAYRKAGAHILDVGVGWFRDITAMGFACTHFPVRELLVHAGSGSYAQRNEDAYLRSETEALAFLQQDYGVVVANQSA